MAVESIQLYATGTGSVADAASIDIPMDGILLGIQIAHRADIDADDEQSTVQVSFLSSAQISTNDARGVLANSTLTAAMVTSGVYPMFANFYSNLNEIKVAAGERLHVHISGSTGVVCTVLLILFLDVSGMGRRQFRRS